MNGALITDVMDISYDPDYDLTYSTTFSELTDDIFKELSEIRCKIPNGIYNIIMGKYTNNEKILLFLPWPTPERPVFRLLMKKRGDIYLDTYMICRTTYFHKDFYEWTLIGRVCMTNMKRAEADKKETFKNRIPNHNYINWIIQDYNYTTPFNSIYDYEKSNRYNFYDFIQKYIRKEYYTAFIYPFIKPNKSWLIDIVTKNYYFDKNILRIIAKLLYVTNKKKKIESVA